MKLNPLHPTSCLIVALIYSMPISTWAIQESETIESSSIGIAISSEDGSQPMVFSAMGSSIDGGPMVMTFGSPMDAMLEMPMALSAGLPGIQSALGLLNNSDIQKEIEMAGDQLKEFKEMQESLRKAISERMADVGKGNLDPQRFKEVGEIVREMTEQQQARLEKMLLPHQLDRLKQIAMQRYLNQSGEANALTNKHLAEELGISSEQQERLKKRSDEIKEELQAKIEELKEQAREKLLQELTPQQRQQFKEMIGNRYEFKPSNELSERIQRVREMRRPASEKD